MKRYYCTYFDKNYLIKGLGLIESLNRHEKEDFQIFVVCLDELTRAILNKINLPNVKTIPLHEIEQRDFPLLEAKQNRSLVEYYWTLTGTVILRILEGNPGIDVLTYLDADLFFYSSLDPIFDELGSYSILIHEHRFPPSRAWQLAYGKYNVGLLCFRNDVNGIEALKWWRDRCIEWCYKRIEDGKFGDQLYLNDWPTRFKNVVVLQNIGAGVGPWNHEQYSFSKGSGDCHALVDNLPLVFYHFHSIAFVTPEIVIPSKIVSNSQTKDILCLCFVPYLNTLSKIIERVRAILPDFDFGIKNEAPLEYRYTFLAKREMRQELERSAIPQFRIPLDSDWNCYCSEQLMEFSTVSGQRSPRLNHLRGAPEGAIQQGREVRGQKFELEGESRTGSPEELYLTAQRFMEGGREKEAIGALRVFLSVYPAYALAHNDLGVLYYNHGNKEKALKHYEQASQLESNNLTFQKNLADFYYFELDRIEEALTIYNKILNEKPEDLEALLVMGHICIKLDKIDSAMDFYSRVLEIDPGNANAIEVLSHLRNA